MKPICRRKSRGAFIQPWHTEKEISVSWEELGYPEHFSAAVRDLWQHKDLGKFNGKFAASVAPHGVVMLTVKP